MFFLRDRTTGYHVSKSPRGFYFLSWTQERIVFNTKLAAQKFLDEVYPVLAKHYTDLDLGVAVTHRRATDTRRTEPRPLRDRPRRTQSIPQYATEKYDVIDIWRMMGWEDSE